MKKNLVRIVAALLVALLALTLIPLGALAAEQNDNSEPPVAFAGSLGSVYFDEQNPEYNEDEIHFDNNIDQIPIYSDKSTTVKASDYENLIELWGDVYERNGLFFAPGTPDSNSTIKMYGSIKIPGFNTSKWDSKYGNLYLGYVPHEHDLSRWYYDGTTHWRECLECKKYSTFHQPFLYQNWCQDGDGDGICNVCGGNVPYHDVTVIASEGGKITVNEQTASHRTKITATVEAADGYTFKQLHFTKVRDNGTRQEITRYQKNGEFWTLMPTYDLEVSAEFVKN